MMPLTILGSKIAIGLLGLIVLLNINISTRHINAKIYSYKDNKFYGDLIINNQKLPVILECDFETYNEDEDINEKEEKPKETTTNTNINKKEDKKEQNEKIVDNKTPGNIKIKIKNEKGQEIVFDRNMGSGEVSEFDQTCINKITDALVEYLGTIKGKSVPKTIKDNTIGFIKYCNKEKNRKWFRW